MKRLLKFIIPRQQEPTKQLKAISASNHQSVSTKSYPSDNGLFDLLPSELLVNIMSHVGIESSQTSCMYVSQYFKDVASEPGLWKEACIQKYGTTLADSTIHLYDGCWKDMLLDDNRRGSVPARLLTVPCQWKNNQNEKVQRNMLRDRGNPSFYCCIVTAIQWDRTNRQVRLYMDIRGEIDLPHPLTSTIKVVAKGSPLVTVSPVHWRGMQSPGHYKGYLTFEDGQFQSDGIYYTHFRYAAQAGPLHKYETAPLLSANLQSTTFNHYTALNESRLFENESREDEKDRWRCILPEWFWQCRPRRRR